MRIGCPKEIKDHEYRVGLTPEAVHELRLNGHDIIVEQNAGAVIGLTDAVYERAGAQIVPTPEEVFAAADLIIKVKEPQPKEITRLRPGQILFTYLHLAADRELSESLMATGATCIAYETVTDAQGGLPLLAPMSEVAGRMAIQAGAHCLEIASGGRGVMLGNVPGVPSASVVIIGGGVVGSNAARVAIGLGASVTLLDTSLQRLREIDARFQGRITTLYSNTRNLQTSVENADLVIGAVLCAGAAAPRLVHEDLVKRMKPGSVIVDVAIDQGGCVETSHPTTHTDPVFITHGVVHYCVANMPGAVARTSTFSLVNATQPYILKLAQEGVETALLKDPGFATGLNIYKGTLTCPAVGKAFSLPCRLPEEVLKPGLKGNP